METDMKSFKILFAHKSYIRDDLNRRCKDYIRKIYQKLHMLKGILHNNSIKG